MPKIYRAHTLVPKNNLPEDLEKIATVFKAATLEMLAEMQQAGITEDEQTYMRAFYVSQAYQTLVLNIALVIQVPYQHDFLRVSGVPGDLVDTLLAKIRQKQAAFAKEYNKSLESKTGDAST